MASYIANNQARDTVTVMLSKAEADALFALADAAMNAGLDDMNNQSKAAARRSMDALFAATSTSARRAGYFDV